MSDEKFILAVEDDNILEADNADRQNQNIGIIIPRMTQAHIDAELTDDVDMIVYNTDTSKWELYHGTSEAFEIQLMIKL